MEELIKIDKEISISAKRLKNAVKNLKFEEICEFNLNKEHIPEIPWGTLNYPGIYLIEIKNNGNSDNFETWVENFKLEWEDEKYMKSFTPNLKKKRNHKTCRIKRMDTYLYWKI